MAKRDIRINLELNEDEVALICKALRDRSNYYDVPADARLALADFIDGKCSTHGINLKMYDVEDLINRGYSLAKLLRTFFQEYHGDAWEMQSRPEHKYWHPSQPRGYCEKDLYDRLNDLENELKAYFEVVQR